MNFAIESGLQALSRLTYPFHHEYHLFLVPKALLLEMQHAKNLELHKPQTKTLGGRGDALSR